MADIGNLVLTSSASSQIPNDGNTRNVPKPQPLEPETDGKRARLYRRHYLNHEESGYDASGGSEAALSARFLLSLPSARLSNREGGRRLMKSHPLSFGSLDDGFQNNRIFQKSWKQKNEVSQETELGTSITTVENDSFGAFVHTEQESGEEEPLTGSNRTSRLFRTLRPLAWSLKWRRWLRVTILTLFVLACAAMFVSTKTELMSPTPVILDQKYIEWYNTTDTANWKYVTVTLYGPFQDISYQSYMNSTNDQSCSQYLFICSPIEPTMERCPRTERKCKSLKIVDTLEYTTVKRTLVMATNSSETPFYLQFITEFHKTVKFQLYTRGEYLSEAGQAAVATAILIFIYLLIGFDIVHRTLAAMIGSTCVLGILSILNKRPSFETVVHWIDLETVGLLFGMMILVAIFSTTGVFDYAAVKAYKLAKGRVWPLIILLCCITTVLSAVLDNVTTMLLIVPVSIRLSEVLNIDPRPVLMAEVMFSNIGGTATAIGDPPNVIIIDHRSIVEAGITFSELTLHLVIGTIITLVVGFFTLWYVVLRNIDLPHITELKREIIVWERAAKQLSGASPEERAIQEALHSKAMAVRLVLHQEECKSALAVESWQRTLPELEQTHRIVNKSLLVKSMLVLSITILLFFLSNVIPNVEMGLGWIAMFAAIIMMILSGIKDLEEVIHKIEWSTLLFFAGLFVFMEGLNQMGLIPFIGMKMVDVIKQVPKDYQMLVALIVILWSSALVSAFIDNVPFVTTMIPLVVELAESTEVCLSLRPLVWALALGGCFGGNGTLIGASANVVCAGISEQHGYIISFFYFMKIGFPMMLCTVFSAMVYLLIAHTGIRWNAPDYNECI